MNPEIPVIQVLEKADHTKQHLVSLPNAIPYPALGLSSIRVRSIYLNLTTNNFIYARLGDKLGWWDIHPLPRSIPTEFADAAKFGRISAWGYGEVIDSTSPIVPKGSLIWGYLPIGTLPVDQQIAPHPGAEEDNQIVNVDPWRRNAMPLYNWYVTYGPGATQITRHRLAWDTSMSLFATAWMLNRFGFAWDAREFMHPVGKDISRLASGPWTMEDAVLGDAVVVAFAAGGKTAACFAHEVRRGRPADAQPRSVVGVCSPASKAFVKGTGFYDHVVLYSDVGPSTFSALGIDSSTKVVLLEFGGRGDVVSRWREALQPVAGSVISLDIGADPTGDADKQLQALLTENRVQVKANGMRSAGTEILGPKAWKDELMKAWIKFVDGGAIPGVKVQWREGMESWKEGWDSLCKGDVRPDTLLVYRI